MKEILNSFLGSAYSMNSNDPLANVYTKGILSLHDDDLNSTPEWEKLIRSAKATEKEFGLNPMCKALGVLSLIWNEKEYHFPLFLSEIKATNDKLTDQITLTILGESQVNPFLVHFFEQQFQLTLPETLEEIQTLTGNYPQLSIETNLQFIGNFHPHRYEIVRDLENLIHVDTFSEPLKQLFGLQDQGEITLLPLSNSNLVQADPDQLEVLKMIESTNCLVQGPPGTGKSQVIINTIGKLIEAKKSTVVVSEKRVALDVIQKKMTALGIGGFCFTTTSHFSNTHFIVDLGKEWKRIEECVIEKPDYIGQYPLQIQELQNTLNLLHHPALAGGISVIDLLKKINVEDNNCIHPYSSSLPNFEEWVQLKNRIEFILEYQLTDLIKSLKTELIEKSYLFSLESKIQSWKQDLKKLSKEGIHLNYQEIYELTRTALQFSKFETQIAKKFDLQIINNPTKRKKIEKIRRDILKLNSELVNLNLENNHWSKLPNLEETKGLIELFSKQGIIQGIKQRKTWKSWTRSPFLNPNSSLESRLKQITLQSKKQEMLSALVAFGVETEQELEEAITFIRSISPEEVSVYHSTTLEKRKYYCDLHPTLSRLITDFQLYFRFENEVDLIDYFNLLEQNFHQLLIVESKFSSSSKTIPYLLKNYSSISEMESAVLSSAWAKVKIDHPQLIDFSWEKLHEKTKQALETEQLESLNFIQLLIQEQKRQFENFHSILRTPNQKLSKENKELKQKLKVGKRILVKEFSKSRNHTSIRLLIESEAQIWISLLKPVWLVNPARMATCFPLNKSLFSVAIFDEASQIPFEHAIGTLQRADRILIAGDPQQMSPSSYFSSRTESVDLLHQANYYLPSLFLSYHYRSQHPALIHFSNSYFYENKLRAFQHAKHDGNPLNFQFVENAYFENRVNTVEAKKVAAYITSKIDSDNSLGIVAFSETQLSCIYSFLPPHTKTKLHDRIELDQVFFKAVENVQGDECDELIISFGYGYTEKDGDFFMRFGPINFSNGSKRLNVLFSRARLKITFFTSVRSMDFKVQSNEAIELLRKWFVILEQHSEKSVVKPLISSVKNIVELNSNMLTINTLISIYQDREWTINLK
jgi:superfamily I DNA and/or RNA helicase